MQQKRFNVSKAEINRRIFAFASLAVTWPALIAVGGLFLAANEQTLALLLATCIFAAMTIIGALTLPFLRRSHLHTTYILEPGRLKRVISHKVKESIDLSTIKAIRVKYTSYGSVRQIALVTNTGKQHNLDGAERFEHLRDSLAKACSGAFVDVYREPINYDHVLFYPAVGAVLAALCLFAVVMTRYTLPQINIIAAASIIAFALAVATYIAAATPLARQYGAAASRADRILACILAIAAIVVVIILLAQQRYH